MSAAAPLPDPAVLRNRAGELTAIAAAAERAAARFAARALTGSRDQEAETISGALDRIARAHRAAGGTLDGYAGELEDAAQRRLALDELVDAARVAPGSDGRVVGQVEELRDELVGRLDRELQAWAERCAGALHEATPGAAEAREVVGAVALALDHAGGRLLELAASRPSIAP